MTTPAYQLRKNKAADRFALIEAIRRLPKLSNDKQKFDLCDYTYYTLGGPYLEDIRLIYEFCPEIGMVSIESDPHTFKRQKFHLPCGHLDLKLCDVRNFISNYESHDEKSIFWLDYIGLSVTNFQDFHDLLGKVAEGSMIKITLRAEPNDYKAPSDEEREQKVDSFRREFFDFLPYSDSYPPLESPRFACLLRDMLHMAVDDKFRTEEGCPVTFYPVSSFYYADSVSIFTLTGIKWPREDDDSSIYNAYHDWEFANLTWDSEPREINLPDLSIKERLFLQECLPRKYSRGRVLRKKLGYLLEGSEQFTENAMEQYAAFHRYFPYFMKGIP